MREPLRAAVVGWPVAHSRSPERFAVLARDAGVALEYRRQPVEPGRLEAALRARDGADVGWNVTVPHKHDALALADVVTPRARRIGAANVLTFRGDGAVVADNTDVDGVQATFAVAGFDARGARALVLGAGGAARAVVEALIAAGAVSVTIANRDAARAARLVAQMRRDGVATVLETATDPVAAAAGAALIVDATSRSRGDAISAFDDEAVMRASAPDALAFDLTYGEPTAFLAAAARTGRRAVDGTPMFEAQAAATFALWFPAAVPAGAGA